MKELELFLNTYMAKSTRGKYEDDIKSFLNYNNIEFDYLRLVDKQIYGAKEQDIEKTYKTFYNF